MSTGQSIRKGSQWLFTGNVGNYALQFIIGVALARLLVPADFGLIVTIQIFTGFVGLISTGGLGQALIRSKEAVELDFQVVFTMQLIVGVIIYLAFFSIAPWFPDWFDNPLYTDLIRISALSFILRPFANIHSSWLHRMMRFREQTIINLISAVVTGITSILMALAGFGVWSLVLGGFAGTIYAAIHLSRTTMLPTRLQFNWARLQRVSGYGSKVVANDLMEYFHKQICNLIISRVAGASTVGLFNKATSLGMMPSSTIGGSVYQPVFREMAKAQDDLDLSKYLFSRMTTLLVVYTLPFYIGLSWLAEPFITFVYGHKWVAAAAPLQIIALGGLFYCILHPCGAILAAHNRLGRELLVHGTATVITGLACYIGLEWGLIGVACGVLAGHFYTTALLFWLVTRTIRTGLSDLMLAIVPGLILGSVLILTLIVTHKLLPSHLADSHPGLYVFTCALSGGFAYCTAFLFIPIQSISSETSRWKNILGFSTNV